MKVKRKKLDIVFSQLVRERANFICQNCCICKRYEQSTLDCAHIMSRRSLALRYHPKNAVSLCRSCHMFFTEHPFDWADWCRDHFGDDLVAELRLVSNKPVKWTKVQREEIYKFYKEKLVEMQVQRTMGLQEMVEFEQHELMHVFGN